MIDSVARRYDVIYMCGVGNGPLSWVPRLIGTRVVLNVDSADWRRAKWGTIARTYLRWTERIAGRVADVVIADNPAIRERYAADYGIASVYIPYGATVGRDTRTTALEPWRLTPRGYVLWVGRLEPETRVEELILAHAATNTGLKLVILGDAPFAAQYRHKLESLAGPEVVFVGRQSGDAYRQLSSHAFAYVQTSPTAGTSPAILDQLGFGNAVIVRGTETNSATIGEAGLRYDGDDAVAGLAAALRQLIDEPRLTRHLRLTAVKRAQTEFDWERIIDRYEELFVSLVADRSAIASSGNVPSRR